MTTSRNSWSMVAAPVFLVSGACLAAWNWYLRPERVAAWATALALLGVMTAVLLAASRRSGDGESGGGTARALTDAVAFAGLILTISLSARLVSILGIDRDAVQRAVMVVVGAFLAFTGNSIPKTLTPLPALRCDPARAQACQRFAGWTWTLTGLAFMAVWLALPEGVATSASMALVASAVTATLAQIVRLRRLPPREA